MSTVLLICSSFFSYPQRISKALEAKGYEVCWLDDRISNAAAYKAALRLAPRLTAKLSDDEKHRRIEALGLSDVSHVIVVKGENLTRRNVLHLRRLYPGARISLYMWDAFRNAPNALDSLDLYDYRGSFDPDDAAKFGIAYRPLFAEPGKAAGPATYDWSFIGTIHSDRYEVLRRFHDATREFSKSYVFGYFPARMIETYYRLRHRDLEANGLGRFGTTALPFAEAQRVVAASRAVLDIEHPAQVGMTMRTIETMLVGRKLVTTNGRIRDSELFHPSRVAVVDRRRPTVERGFFDVPFEPLAADVTRYFSIDAWADEVLGARSEKA